MRHFFALWATLATASVAQGQADTASRMSMADRLYMASRVYALVESYFNGAPDLGARLGTFDSAYRHYLTAITSTDDRRTFDLATMRLVAVLRNGHTGFDDQWLEARDGGALGFYAEPVDGHWVVTRSALAEVHVGDAIDAIEGTPTEEFFQANRPYLMDSDERSEREDLFGATYLFPNAFAVTLADHRTVRIKKTAPPSTEREPVEGRWLDSAHVAYIRMPSFGGIESEAEALTLVRRFKSARGLIIDLRGNPGGFGNPPLALQASLMDRPFRAWHESLGRFASPDGNLNRLASGSAYATPENGMAVGLYTGRLVILVDRICASYCEDFVMPFADNHRATLVGDTTAGTYAQTHFTAFENGMSLNIAVTHAVFPNGNQFEGVGIVPDIVVTPTIADIRSRTDMALQRALALIRA